MRHKFLVLALILFPIIGNAAGVPTSFTYQGKALNAAGTAPLTSTVSFTLSITDPSSACILYQETQSNINLATTNGIFALQVGSLTGATKRNSGVDPGLTMTSVFANAGTQLVGVNGSCPGYTPSPNDVRKLHVVITPSAGSPITVSPDLTINSVPNSMVAETVQGVGLSVLTPPGMVMTYSGTTCPTGYLLANGATVSATTYPTLASSYVNGSTYLWGGTVAGGTFTLPDFRGIFLRGAGTNGSLTNSNGVPYSTTSGTYQTDQMQGHYHGNTSPANIAYYSGGGSTIGFYHSGSDEAFAGAPVVTSPISDGINGTPRTGVETRPANAAVSYCIKY